mmetsp:Transcript_49564/g.116494  ORF Transcript_49564/g.116494 Transcript_49564/m.116494 type:complete len:203 (-) Transcript_49564:340-948(-)
MRIPSVVYPQRHLILEVPWLSNGAPECSRRRGAGPVTHRPTPGGGSNCSDSGLPRRSDAQSGRRISCSENTRGAEGRLSDTFPCLLLGECRDADEEHRGRLVQHDNAEKLHRRGSGTCLLPGSRGIFRNWAQQRVRRPCRNYYRGRRADLQRGTVGQRLRSRPRGALYSRRSGDDGLLPARSSVPTRTFDASCRKHCMALRA